MASADQKLKNYIGNVLRTNPSFRKAIEEMPDINKVDMKKLDPSTTSHIQTLYDITEEQAHDLWEKLFTFNQLLMKKYGDTYIENSKECIKLIQQYKMRMIMKYKK